MNHFIDLILKALHLDQVQKINDFDLSVRFFLQLAVILAVCRVVGALGKKLGQPQVVGEMIAGVLMGPSLLPHLGEGVTRLQGALFPAQSFTVLFSASQVALSLYMFIVGLEFRTDLFTNKARSAALVSGAGMITPFILGGLIGLWLVKDTGTYFNPKIQPFEAALYLGACLCITAFPMLARIIYARRWARYLLPQGPSTMPPPGACWPWSLPPLAIARPSPTRPLEEVSSTP
jgi:Kef-type K+ transport system membrane component KefB